MWQLKIAAIWLFFTSSCLVESQQQDNLGVSDVSVDLSNDTLNYQSRSHMEDCICVPDGICNDNVAHSINNTHKNSKLCRHELYICCDPSKILLTEQSDEYAQIGEFPSMVLVMPVQNASNLSRSGFPCGGSLVHPMAVLTSARCVLWKEPSELWVRAGDWNVNAYKDILHHSFQTRDVAHIINHPEYIESEMNRDYAVLILSSPFVLNELVNVIEFPEPNSQISSSLCFGLGWGMNVYNQFLGTLKKIPLPLISRSECQKFIQGSDLFYGVSAKHFLRDNEICAGGSPGKDLCAGDSVGPLVCQLEDKPSEYVQVGITSWGFKGECFIGYPTTFSEVVIERDWIDDVLAVYIPTLQVKAWYCSLLSWAWWICS